MDCKTKRRFAKKDLSELCEYLGIPEKITLVQRTVCGGMEGPVHFVEEVGIPCKYTGMVPCFGSNR